MNQRRIVYLDYSASTPTDPRVVEAMMPYFTQVYGNPSSAHSVGRRAEQAIEDAREIVASIFNCHPSEVIFTSGGTESDNLAVRGAGWWLKQTHKGAHLVTTPVEHSAIGRTVAQMSDLMGFDKTLLPVDALGCVNPTDFEDACRRGVSVASVVYANNEVGTVQNLSELTAIAHEHDVLFHTDAVQAAGQLSLDVQALGVDMMSISAHKFYGPKGVGALYARKDIELTPSQSGGSHEGGRRAGTHNTPLIVGLAKALQLAYEEREQRLAHYTQLRDSLITGILTHIPGAQLTGHATQRLPSHASFIFDGIDGNKLLMHMDMRGVCASSASACKTGNPSPSDVLLAMGYPTQQALGSLRLSVGKDTTVDDVDFAIQVIVESIESIQKFQKALSKS